MTQPLQNRLRILRFRFSTRLKSLFFPIDGRDLIEVVKKIGYQATPPPTPMPRGARVRLGLTGDFAKKEGITLDVNSDRGILGASADTSDLAIKAFDEFSALILDEFGIDLEKESRFYEIIAEVKFDSDENPLKSIADIFEGSPLVSKVGEILKHDVSLYTLRFVTKDKVPNQEEWLDITIEPDLLMPHQKYAVSVVFRSKDKSIVKSFGENLKSNLLQIIEAIESP